VSPDHRVVTESPRSSLDQLAQLYGVESSFYDGLGIQRNSPPEVVISVLRSLGVPLANMGDVPEALREARRNFARSFVEPVLVLWEGEPFEVTLQLPEAEGNKIVRCRLEGEAGDVWNVECRPEQRIIVGQFSDDGETFVRFRITLPAEIPVGYYKCSIASGVFEENTTLIVAPLRAYQPASPERQWGVFLPLYALRTERDWGAGDFTDLRQLIEWTAGQGAGFFGTLPLFPTFLDEPLDPSPYSPVSRLFWNEFYLDPTLSPQWSASVDAQRTFGQSTVQAELKKLREMPLVDYRNVMATKKSILQHLARTFFSQEGASQEIENLATHLSEVRDYAAFRAYHEQTRKGWREWPALFREGHSPEKACSPERLRYYLYTQWLCRQQLSPLLQNTEPQRLGLYLDLPLGTHPDGYDVWRHQKLFAVEVSGGAPPDTFFTGGQTWGFPPLIPEACRRDGHSYFRKCLQFLLKNSDLIRIDHVMSLHRLYWVPEGASARDGVYVRYPVEELYSILCLESHRQNCTIVGEDLGTVPPVIRQTMDKHQILRMYVAQFEVTSDENAPIREVPSPVVASLDTHDTPTFASFWRGLDLELREKIGLMDREEIAEERVRRERFRRAVMNYFDLEGDPEDGNLEYSILRHWLGYIASSPARYLLVNLEDLWLETQPQNVPGTTSEQRPNWRRKASLTLAEIQQSVQVASILEEVNLKRRHPAQLEGEDP